MNGFCWFHDHPLVFRAGLRDGCGADLRDWLNLGRASADGGPIPSLRARCATSPGVGDWSSLRGRRSSGPLLAFSRVDDEAPHVPDMPADES